MEFIFIFKLRAPIHTSRPGYLCIVDIIECDLETSFCDDNATCANTIGSYICTCNDGFTGEGGVGTCEGIYVVQIAFMFFS